MHSIRPRHNSSLSMLTSLITRVTFLFSSFRVLGTGSRKTWWFSIIGKQTFHYKRGNPVCDHLAISCTIHLNNPPKSQKEVSFDVVMPSKWTTLQQISHKLLHSRTVTGHLVLTDDTELHASVDEHAPLQVKTTTLRPNTAWCTEQLRNAKRHMRKREHVWRKSHHELYREELKIVSVKLYHLEQYFYACEHDHQKTLKLTGSLMGKNICRTWPIDFVISSQTKSPP